MRYGRRSGTAPTRFRITSLNRHSGGALYAMRPGLGRAGLPLFHLLYFPKTRPVVSIVASALLSDCRFVLGS
jgi:hypothetical protein